MLCRGVVLEVGWHLNKKCDFKNQTSNGFILASVCFAAALRALSLEVKFSTLNGESFGEFIRDVVGECGLGYIEDALALRAEEMRVG